jgi:hypothetical protein
MIQAIQEVRSKWILPYLLHNQHRICDHCAKRGADCCPCPLQTLAPLIVPAIKNVEARWALQVLSEGAN